MNPFELAEPATLEEAVAMLVADDPAVRPIAGGTALMLMMKGGWIEPRRLVSLRRVEPAHARIAFEADGGVRIGALATLASLEADARLLALLPALGPTLRTLSSVRIRNVATVGGHLAHGDPHMDLPPLLVALGARVDVLGPDGARSIAVEDLFTGYLETVLRRNELIARLVIPAQAGATAAYLKVTTRAADDWPALGVAVRLRMEGDRIRDAAVVISAATDRVTRLPAAEAALRGARADDGTLRRLGEAVATAPVIGDAHGSEAYKRALLRVHAGRAIRRALGLDASTWERQRAVAVPRGPAAADAKAAGRTQVGRSIARLEARDKVTGRAEYIHNLRLPGMLHGKACRSTVPHARIRSIDTRAAAAMPGVFGVITAEDILRVIPDPYYGPAFHDQPILAHGKVRHIGEPVALVLATDPHVAEAAARAIEVEYEPLPAVFDEVEAATSTAMVHDVLRPAGTFPDLKHLEGRKDTNVALDFVLRRGDTGAAFRDAAHVFEHTFRTQQVMHTPLEPMVSICDPTASPLTVHTSSQMPSFVRIEIARLLGWPENKVRVRTAFLGGGFGAKVYIKVEALAVAAALIARRPVRIALTMEEQFYTITKHPTTVRIRSAVSKEGRVTGRRCEAWWNGGAYADIGPRVTQKSGFTAAGPYDIEHVDLDSHAMYTNLPPAGALRGFGIPQLAWAYESHTDLIARALDIDPVAFRRANILREGRPQATGTLMRDAAIEAVLDRVAERIGWGRPFDRGSGNLRRGRGVAIGFKASISPTTSVATVNLHGDGSCVVLCGTVDMGQGSDTAMAQIAGEVLGIDAGSVRVIHPDTDVTPYDMGTLGSRSTYHMGLAVKRAAEDARDKCLALAAELGMPAETTTVGALLRRRFGMQAGTIVGTGTMIPGYIPTDHDTGQSTNVTPFWMIGGAGAEVEVDTETGQFSVARLVNVADAGTPINPAIVDTQLSGGAIMQLGHTLTEKMEFDAGQLRNPSFADYKIPGLRDMPARMDNETVDARQESGPFGAKGVGETATFGVSAAIANAIHDAVGIRLTELPLTAEALYRALQARDGATAKDS